jgi:hypothetical protein
MREASDRAEGVQVVDALVYDCRVFEHQPQLLLRIGVIAMDGRGVGCQCSGFLGPVDLDEA